MHPTSGPYKTYPHFRKRSGRWVRIWREHGSRVWKEQYQNRWIIESELGRKLEPWEHVHHRDGNKANDDRPNLVPVDGRAHLKGHGLIATLEALARDTPTEHYCPRCKRTLAVSAFTWRKNGARRLPQAYCRECMSAYGREWRAAHR